MIANLQISKPLQNTFWNFPFRNPLASVYQPHNTLPSSLVCRTCSQSISSLSLLLVYSLPPL